ncbi:MAG: hypothetical protein WCK89_04690 [bacterium]
MKKLLTVLSGVISMSSVMASEPVQLSLTPDFAIFDRNERIEGVALSIWGENPQSAFALGFVNGSTGDSVGLSVGLVNYADSYMGCQWSFVNYTKGDFTGWQGGPFFGLLVSGVNYTEGNMNGFQCGLMNYAGKLNGLQVGLVNVADTAKSGVQIGIVNIMPENEWFSRLPDELAPGMVLVNWHF